METQDFVVRLDRLDNLQFSVDFIEPASVNLTLDEPPPLGDGVGPNATRMLAAAIGNCLGASLLFCLSKAHVEIDDLVVTARGTLERNDAGRMRIKGISVELDPGVAAANPRMDRCLEIFEDYCIVTQSVREGIPVDVTVKRPTAGLVGT